MRTCTACKNVLDDSMFYKRSDLPNKYHCKCKKCSVEYNNKQRKKTALKYYSAVRKHYYSNRDKMKKYYLSKRYNISIEKYDSMYDTQCGKCAICGKDILHISSLKNVKESAAVDHCHKTGEVRGLLCKNCNTGLGMFCDSVENLKNAIIYLQKQPKAL